MEPLRRGVLLLVVFPVLLMHGCHQKNKLKSSFAYTHPVLDSCSTDPGHKFWVSMPAGLPPDQKLPLVLAIDPHGDGRLAVHKFTNALKDIPAIVAGSMKVRNNCLDFEAAISGLLGEVRSGYPADADRPVVAGFSGGGRMAFYYGMSHPVTGIIMYGAGPGSIPQGKEKLPIYAVTGTRDFNFAEQYAPLFSGLDGQKSYVTDYFRGPHEWPPAEKIRESVAYVLKNGPYIGEAELKDMSESFMEQYDSLLGSGDLFFAGKALEKAWHFAPDSKRGNRISARIEAFSSLPEWNTTRDDLESYMRTELKIRKAYAQKLVAPDTIWWKNEIRSLYGHLTGSPDSTREDFYHRIKGYLGIILYSKINGLFRRGIFDEQADQLLVIYGLVEPASADFQYFRALLNYKRGEIPAASTLLESALEQGFSDYLRIRQDFPSPFLGNLPGFAGQFRDYR